MVHPRAARQFIPRILPFVVAIVTLTTLGCGMESHPPPRATTSGQTASASGDAVAASATPTPGADVGAPCRSSDLRVDDRGGDAGAGNRVIRLALVNERAGACVLDGYPEVGLVDSAGHAVPVSVTHDERTYFDTGVGAARVTLGRGAAMEFSIAFNVVDGAPGGCALGAAIRVGAPGDTAAVGLVARSVRACRGRLTVTPLAPPR